jgi:crotonobetainyl-CoA:carnitine CoA-transferase CaiB-like acyl-CoA transferase
MASSDGPLRVLDLTSTLGGAYAARLLSAGGVELVRAEPPGGHWLRRWSASGAASADEDTGALFQWLAGGQQNVTVDPENPADLAELLEWATTMDAVLWTPGFALEQLREAAPTAVITAITSFGLDGPWSERAATEFTLQALSGAPAMRGSRAWPPMTAGGQHGEYMVGVFAAVATMLGLRRRTLSGLGGVIDLSALESVIMTQLFNPITMETMETGPRPRRAKATVGDVVASKDGYVGFAVVNRLQHWHDFCALIGHVEWADDPTLDVVWNRAERSDELNPLIRAWTSERTTAEIVELATLMRIPAIEVGNGATIPHMDHFAEAGFYETNPEGGFLQPAPPFRFHPPLAGVVSPRAPGPTTPIRSAARPAGAGPAPPAAVAGAVRPFDGLRVADFTSFWAGPFLTHSLGMFGADVIHIESTARPDGARLMGHRPATDPQWWEWSSFFHATNTNKRGITLDMGEERGRALARRVVAECDVVVENYSPRVLESWGLGWDDVRAMRPDAVMVRMPAFGLSGPWRDRTGFAMTMEQVSGMAWLTGFPEHSPGALFGPCDPGAGLHALLGLMFALEARRLTGEGRLVEAPMVAGALNVAAEQVIEHSAYGALLSRMGNRGAAAAPQNCYRSNEHEPDGQSRWVAIAVADDDQWAALVSALGDPPWATSAELATATGRRAHHDDIDRELQEWCGGRSSGEIVDCLSSAGVPAEPVVHPSEQLGFEQLVARGFFESVRHPISGDSVHVTYPFRLPGHEGAVHRRPAPTLGQHNGDVLRELLGLPDDEIAGLREAGIIGETLAR